MTCSPTATTPSRASGRPMLKRTPSTQLLDTGLAHVRRHRLRANRATRRPSRTSREATNSTFPVSVIGGAAAAGASTYVLVTYVLGMSTMASVNMGRETVRMDDFMMDSIVIAYSILITIDLHVDLKARCRRAATPSTWVRMRKSGLCDLAVRPRAPRVCTPVEGSLASMERTVVSAVARTAGTAAPGGASRRPRIRWTPPTRLQRAQWTQGRHLRMRASRATRSPPHTFVEPDGTTLHTLEINGADMMDTLDCAMMIFHLGEYTKTYTDVVKVAVEMTYLVVYSIADALSVGFGIYIPDASIERPREAATTSTLTKRGMSGGRNLALTSRMPRACIPVAAPQALTKGNMSGGCNLALTSRMPRA